ncbi:hypothetical protein [Pseudomonas asgharzadehiana]|uniref:Uncharacterized protein n=1 Tax=Pseudomonas asgharzadehiana TaxID=2842349 RepID=A0ABX8NW97_9PSED|nr:hypothetical protein [Pseudomonas asgharzadehiana]QXH65833.1 hypothetical protein KSS96_19770 [Pseudomonas asgharzadehiana]
MNDLLIEPESLAVLRHRWARLLEIHTAYKAFLHGEVLVGPNKSCPNEVVANQTTDTLLTIYYSYLYSMFDETKKATNFLTITKELLSELSQEAKDSWGYISDLWSENKKEIMLLRHKIGFHGEQTYDALIFGYKQYHQINPLIPEQLMLWMKVFFRYAHLVYATGEPLVNPLSKADADEMFNYATHRQQALIVLLTLNSAEFIDSIAKENAHQLDDRKAVMNSVIEKFNEIIGLNPKGKSSDTIS